MAGLKQTVRQQTAQTRSFAGLKWSPESGHSLYSAHSSSRERDALAFRRCWAGGAFSQSTVDVIGACGSPVRPVDGRGLAADT